MTGEQQIKQQKAQIEHLQEAARTQHGHITELRSQVAQLRAANESLQRAGGSADMATSMGLSMPGLGIGLGSATTRLQEKANLYEQTNSLSDAQEVEASCGLWTRD